MLTAKSHQDEVHVSKVRNTKEQSIFILSFKKYVSTILRGLGEGNKSTTTLTAIRTPDICDYHDGVRVVYPQASKCIQYQILKRNAGINRDIGRHMKVRLLASEVLVKCGVF